MLADHYFSCCRKRGVCATGATWGWNTPQPGCFVLILVAGCSLKHLLYSHCLCGMMQGVTWSPGHMTAAKVAHFACAADHANAAFVC